MMSLLKIAVRNTRRQMKRTLLLAGAIAFGVMVITLFNAFTAGLEENIKRNVSYAFGGHLFISGSQVSESGRLMSRIEDDALLRSLIQEAGAEVSSVHRRSRALVTLIFGSKQATERVEGVDFAVETDLAKGLLVRAGSVNDLSDERLIFVTAPTAEKLGVQVGEQVLARLLTVTGQQNVGEFKVAAIIEDPTNLGFATAYAHRVYLNSLLGLGPDEYQLMNVFLRDLQTSDALAARVHGGLTAAGFLAERPLQTATGNLMEMDEQGEETFGALFGFPAGGLTSERWEGTKFSITTLNEMMEPLETILGVLNGIALAIFLILLAITMVGITNTFRMILIERTREVGTMRAFGMQRATVRRIFLLEAAVIGAFGSVAGIALALLGAAVLGSISFAQATGLQFFLDGEHLTFVLSPAVIVGNVAIVLAMSLFAAYMPARAAARLEPAKALGSHF